MLIRLDKLGKMPNRAYPTDAGLDILAPKTIWLSAGDVTMVDTQVSVKVPEGYVGLLFQRSSYTKLGIRLANAVGVIDSSYTGNIKVAFRVDGDTGRAIAEGDKLAQLVIVPILLPTLEVVECSDEEWSNTARGTGGFGSTGK
jgi:dUTP pyrophosphatase